MKHLLAASLAATLFSANAAKVAYFPMEINGGKVSETVSGISFDILAATAPESAAGLKGKAVRFDGYSNYMESMLPERKLDSFTFSLWCAMETWPIIEHDVQNETDFTCIAGNYDAVAKSGMGFFINRVGKLSFRFFSNGWPAEITASSALPLYRWNNLAAVCDGSTVTFYLNGEPMGSTKAKGVVSGGKFMIGKSAEDRKLGMFNVNTVNGIIDEIEILDTATAQDVVKGWKSDVAPQLSAVAAGKYDDDLMRPRFHGMPSRGWTNETHGLVHHNGRYHVFFQKNANGPYMSRLQWGHIVSDNLYQWEELPIAIGSDKWYDLKGCWSGCVAVDDVVTGGVPNIIYTGVDYARAMIGQASPADDDLLSWNKRPNPIIDGKPAGLSDDFRDPYFFRNGNDAYIIVGSSKDGRGACTLHKFDNAAKSWSNDGKLFFSAASVAGQGSFWEMPNMTHMDGKWLFTVTPLGINTGVKALYWTGGVNADGTFAPKGGESAIELPGFAKEGFGLLSPSIVQHEGKTLAMGIVPDKLPGSENYRLGWAHTYSLPREWSLGSDGKLVQKPFSGLAAMRVADSKVSYDNSLQGSAPLGNMTDRQAEIVGEFTVADADFGFSLFKNTDNELKISYSPATSKFTVDMRALKRISNDAGVFDGLYVSTLPEAVAKGSVMKIQVFVDHSILDIFINDRWASSVRVFPTDAGADGMEAFSDGGATRARIDAWSLNAAPASIGDLVADDAMRPVNELVDVYDISGVAVRRNVLRSAATDSLPSGLYIVDGRKVLIR